MSISVAQATGANPTAYSGVNTVTLGYPTSAGNCLVACIWGPEFGASNPSSVGVTLGGSAGNFAQIYTVGTYADNGVWYIWADPNCAGGQTSVVTTLTGGTAGDTPVFVYVYEIIGLVSSSLLDVDAGQPAGNTGGSTGAFTSGSTTTTAQANEIWIGGASSQWSSVSNFTGPALPWSNLPQLGLSNIPTTGDFESCISGFQVVSATGAAAYAGTQSLTTGQYTAFVVTLKGASTAPPGKGPRTVLQAVKRAATY